MTIKELFKILKKAGDCCGYLDEVRDEYIIIDGSYDIAKLEEELKKWELKK